MIVPAVLAVPRQRPPLDAVKDLHHCKYPSIPEPINGVIIN